MSDLTIDNLKKIIPNSETWSSAKRISFGWSGEQKYIIETSGSERLLLRILSHEQYSNQEKGIELLEKCNKYLSNTPKLLTYGTTLDDKNHYLLLNYIDGTDGMVAIEKLPTDTQYQLGIDMGRTIKILHSLTTPSHSPQIHTTLISKFSMIKSVCREFLQDYAPLRDIISYIDKNISLIKDRPVTMLHNDFHLGNMIINNNQIFLIDFNRATEGDNIKEFDCIAWSVTHSIPFATGLLDEYLKDTDIEEFFKIHRLYVAMWQLQMLSFIKDEPPEEKQVVMDLINFTNTWYTDNSTIPNWYVENTRLGVKNSNNNK